MIALDCVKDRGAPLAAETFEHDLSATSGRGRGYQSEMVVALRDLRSMLKEGLHTASLRYRDSGAARSTSRGSGSAVSHERRDGRHRVCWPWCADVPACATRVLPEKPPNERHEPRRATDSRERHPRCSPACLRGRMQKMACLALGRCSHNRLLPVLCSPQVHAARRVRLGHPPGAVRKATMLSGGL